MLFHSIQTFVNRKYIEYFQFSILQHHGTFFGVWHVRSPCFACWLNTARVPYLWIFFILSQILGGAPYIQKCLVVWKLWYQTVASGTRNYKICNPNQLAGDADTLAKISTIQIQLKVLPHCMRNPYALVLPLCMRNFYALVLPHCMRYLYALVLPHCMRNLYVLALPHCIRNHYALVLPHCMRNLYALVLPHYLLVSYALVLSHSMRNQHALVLPYCKRNLSAQCGGGGGGRDGEAGVSHSYLTKPDPLCRRNRERLSQHGAGVLTESQDDESRRTWGYGQHQNHDLCTWKWERKGKQPSFIIYRKVNQ